MAKETNGTALQKISGHSEAEYTQQVMEMQKEHEYELLKVEADTKVKGAAMRENLERLLRVIFLRDTKARLKPLGQWSRWCQDTGINIKTADDEIDKIGEFRQETLLSFGSHVGYAINKIKYLTAGEVGTNSGISGVVVENDRLIVDGEEVEMTPDEIKLVIEARDERLRKQEEDITKEKSEIEKQHAETKKALKKVERELSKIKGEARKKDVPPEEIAFVQELEDIKNHFEVVIHRLDEAGFEANAVQTPRMATTASALLDYMKTRLNDVWVRTE